MNKFILSSLLLATCYLNGEPFRLQYPEGVTVEENVSLSVSYNSYIRNDHDVSMVFDLTKVNPDNEFVLLARVFSDKLDPYSNKLITKVTNLTVPFRYDIKENWHH